MLPKASLKSLFTVFSHTEILILSSSITASHLCVEKMHLQISRTAFVELGAYHRGRNVAKFNKNIFLFAKKFIHALKNILIL